MTRSFLKSALLVLAASLLGARADNPISPGFPYGSTKVRVLAIMP